MGVAHCSRLSEKIVVKVILPKRETRIFIWCVLHSIFDRYLKVVVTQGNGCHVTDRIFPIVPDIFCS